MIHATTDPIEALLAFPFLASIDQYYPGMTDWYVNQVVPGLVEDSSVLLLAKRQQRIVGMALGKKGHEAKLRCVRVLPEMASQGLGIRLIDRMFEHLGTDKPHCTVSEELLHSYSRIFVSRYGFELNQVSKGLYRPLKLEYHFN